MLKGFRDFIMRDNVVDLAVAVVIGVAFAAVVSALLSGLVTPLIAALFGQPSLDSVGTFSINDAQFSIGVVLTALINFLIIGAVIYFVVIVPMNKVTAYMRRNAADVAEAQSEEVVLLTEIRDALRQRS